MHLSRMILLIGAEFIISAYFLIAFISGTQQEMDIMFPWVCVLVSPYLFFKSLKQHSTYSLNIFFLCVFVLLFALHLAYHYSPAIEGKGGYDL